MGKVSSSPAPVPGGLDADADAEARASASGLTVIIMKRCCDGVLCPDQLSLRDQLTLPSPGTSPCLQAGPEGQRCCREAGYMVSERKSVIVCHYWLLKAGWP